MDQIKNKVFSIFKTVCFCWKNLIKFSGVWTIVLIIVALISSFSIIINAKLLEKMVNLISYGESIEKLYPIVIFWLISILAMNLFTLMNKYINIHINEQMENGFLPIIIDKYNNIEYYQFENKETQNLFQHINSSSHSEIVLMFNVSINIITSIITIVEMIYIFISSVWWVGIASIIITIPLVFFNLRSAYIEMKQRWTMTKDIRKRYYFQSLFANKSSLQEIKIFNSKDYFINESEKLTQVINDDLKKNIGIVTKLKLLFSITLCIFTSIVILGSSQMILKNQLQLGTFVMLVESIALFINAEIMLSNNMSSIVRISEKVKLIFDFFELPEVVLKNKENATFSQLKTNKAIEFENVSFSYPGCDKEVLKNVSFSINKGEIISFVGINGSGKSTIIKLMCGLYKANSGTIKINGFNISDLSYEEIRKQLAIVFQDGECYQLSLRENIGIGDISQMNNDEKLKSVLSLAGVKDIFGLKNELNQNLGLIEEDAVDLSGGQWQKVLIARAFFSPANILVLDEPTSALDPIVECELYKTIYTSIANFNKTSILISHRLASCVLADRILVLKDGEICESGSHNDLLQLNGYYSKMFLKQQSWYK